MAMQYRVMIVLVPTLLLSLVTTQIADGEVPSAADIAACNEQAPLAIKAGTASPTLGDHARADTARRGAHRDALTSNPGDFRTAVVESPNPQIHGMDAEGAKDPAYQAAYRSCMRQKGF